MVKSAASTAILCLTLNIYHEAGAEPVKGKQAVAHVTINRSKNKRDICNIVYEKDQFSWTKAKHRKADRSSKTWILSSKVAKDAFYKNSVDPTKGATHFHATYVRPDWANKLDKTTKIGKHIFYKGKNKK